MKNNIMSIIVILCFLCPSLANAGGKSDENNKFFNEGKKNGQFREDLKPEFILYMFERSINLIEDEPLKIIFPDIKERSDEITKFLFYGLASIKKEATDE